MDVFWPHIAILGFVTLQRVGELNLAKHNTAALLARGAREAAPGLTITAADDLDRFALPPRRA